ncbi:Hypothetical_protein [Hexamita inflata]|uniref:Hypothetical_protein n=1 Tax=Hexamita inflata TaxID=28002 RepID=A0AA86UGJ6_9EUKA|nr:Hypothetical protein HINF_LOCUS27243 [Hexamita inflata]
MKFITDIQKKQIEQLQNCVQMSSEEKESVLIILQQNYVLANSYNDRLQKIIQLQQDIQSLEANFQEQLSILKKNLILRDSYMQQFTICRVLLKRVLSLYIDLSNLVLYPASADLQFDSTGILNQKLNFPYFSDSESKLLFQAITQIQKPIYGRKQFDTNAQQFEQSEIQNPFYNDSYESTLFWGDLNYIFTSESTRIQSHRFEIDSQALSGNIFMMVPIDRIIRSFKTKNVSEHIQVLVYSTDILNIQFQQVQIKIYLPPTRYLAPLQYLYIQRADLKQELLRSPVQGLLKLRFNTMQIFMVHSAFCQEIGLFLTKNLKVDDVYEQLLSDFDPQIIIQANDLLSPKSNFKQKPININLLVKNMFKFITNEYEPLRYFWSGAELYYLQKNKTQFPKMSRNDFNANPVLTQNELLKESGFKVLKMIKKYPEAKELFLQEQQDVLFNTYFEQPLLINVKSNREIQSNTAELLSKQFALQSKSFEEQNNTQNNKNYQQESHEKPNYENKTKQIQHKSALKHEDVDLTEQDLTPSKNNSWYGQNKRTVRQLSEIVHREKFSIPTRDRDCEDSDYYYHYTDYSDDERHNQ